MKVFVEPPDVISRCLQRVTHYLKKYAPRGIVWTEKPEQADLVVLHVIGRRNAVWKAAQACKRYAIIQYCVRSTKNPLTRDWQDVWQKATCVWSYYNLHQLMQIDGTQFDFPFYHAPLGVDASVFYPRNVPKSYIIGTNGFSALTEGSKEAARAAAMLGFTMFHLGPDVKVGAHVTCKQGISDDELAEYFSACHLISGLRRIEGFELPAAEGLLCGARPVFYDAPHYRQWFNEWGIFIPERPREDVVNSLTEVFSRDIPPITPLDRQAAQARFNWQTLVTRFWERSL